MEYINRHIANEVEKTFSIKYKDVPRKKMLLIFPKEPLNKWLERLRISMHLTKYRQVINEIENKKRYYSKFPEEKWRYLSIEIDAIFKILRKKITHHKKEITKENSRQSRACMFWLNQMFLILEHLVLSYRPDLNKNLNFNNESIIRPVRCILEGYIKLIFTLLVFSQLNHQIHEVCTYISIVDKFLPYLVYTTDNKTYVLLQQIQILKVKLFIANCDYANALEELGKNIDFCCSSIRFLGDDEYNIYYYNEKGKYDEEIKYMDYINTQSSIYSNNKEFSALSQQKSSSNLNMQNFFLSNQPKIKISSKNIKVIRNLNLKEKESSKNLSKKNILNNDDSASGNNLKLKQTQSAKNIFLTFVKPKKRIKMNPRREKMIEENFSNIALNFYLRAAIFEHLGNIDSALDSYKELEWFSNKFLTKKFPNFVKYMTNLLNVAWHNYNIIHYIKEEKERRNQLKLLRKETEESKANFKLHKSIFTHHPLHKLKLYKLKNDEKKLKVYLKNIGKKLYKEEENRNYNIFNRFTKTGYILSSFKMINSLLSDDFRHILKKMEKVEIERQKEEIKNLVNKTLIKLNEKSFSGQLLNDTRWQSTTNYLKRDISNKSNNTINYTKINLVSLKNQSSAQKKPAKTYSYLKLLTPYKKNSDFSMNSSDIKISELKKMMALPDGQKRDKNLRKLKIIKRNNSALNLSKRSYSYSNFKISRIEKSFNNRAYSGYRSLRASRRKEKVERLPVDRENFSKKIIEKKNFLEKFCDKELNFQKNLLKIKSLEKEYDRPPETFDIKKAKKDAEMDFNLKFELAKSSREKKNLNNLIKHNYKIIKKNNELMKKRSRNGIPGDDDNFINETKLKELDMDCFKLFIKNNELAKKKKFFLMYKNL